MGYDVKYRQRTVEYRQEGDTIEETAKVFKVCTDTVKRWVKQYTQTGELKNKSLHRSFKKINPEKLAQYVEEHPDAYLYEMADEFGCSETAIRKALKKQGITRKKRPSGTESKTPHK